MEVYAAVRRFVFVEGNSQREAARVFGISRTAVEKMCSYSAPPGYRRKAPPKKPKLDPFIPIIDAILKADMEAPRKQRHTAQRIFERLRDEHGYDGGVTIVRAYVREARQRTAEKFVPLAHPPGHAQVEVGEATARAASLRASEQYREATAVIGGVRRKIHAFFMDLSHSDAAFMKASAAETTEAFLDGHVAALVTHTNNSAGTSPQKVTTNPRELPMCCPSKRYPGLRGGPRLSQGQLTVGADPTGSACPGLLCSRDVRQGFRRHRARLPVSTR